MCKIKFIFVAAILFYSCDNPIVVLGNGYEYNIECHHIISEHFDIPPYIVEYNFDDAFIVAKQKPTHYFNGIYDYPSGFSKEKYYLGLNALYYWIIDKKKNIAYGPLDSVGFKIKCKDVRTSLDFD